MAGGVGGGGGGVGGCGVIDDDASTVNIGAGTGVAFLTTSFLANGTLKLDERL